ncbi:hypothetical protein CPBF1521_05510 [Xanthomonas arboricola pv. juglandis]|nr:hypothetical protein CPBF1521_05510 [Xanthomonas arboricola pv. juglandis]SYZ58520.1 hypothetical protein CPBF427_06130 [Xanthomonas arboricola pv. juglandis]
MSLCRALAAAKATSMPACGGAALRTVSVNGVLVLVAEQNAHSANQGGTSTARAAACKQATA